nr:tetratricopeptide repeat protein [Micromonospora sp. DSM 115978]
MSRSVLLRLLSAANVLLGALLGAMVNLLTSNLTTGLLIFAVTCLLVQVVISVLLPPPGDPPPDRSPGPSGPFQLPPDNPDFTNRSAELALLKRWIEEPGPDGGARLIVIEGLPGIGKSALAVHLAHELVAAGRFTDAQLTFEFDTVPDAARTDAQDVLGHLLRDLGVDPAEQPERVDRLASRYRDRLHGRRALVLLDGPDSRDQVEPLLPGDRNTLVLVTSRQPLNLPNARELVLAEFTDADGVALFEQLIDDRLTGADRAVVEQIIRECGNLPVAIAPVAAGGRRRRNRSARLAAAREQISRLAGSRAAPEWAFAYGYDRLPPDAQRMFRRLSIHPALDCPVPVAAVLADVDEAGGGRLAGELLDAYLLHEPPAGHPALPPRLRMHELRYRFAGRMAERDDPADDRGAAARRLLRWYLHAVADADRLIAPWRRHPPIGDRPANALALPDRETALAWLDAERPTLVGVVDLAARLDEAELAWQLTVVMYGYLDLRKHRGDWLATNLRAIEATADRPEHRYGHAWVLSNLGNGYLDMDRRPQAIEYFRRAVAIREELGDDVGQAASLASLGNAYSDLGEPGESIRHHRRALEIRRRIGHPHESVSLECLGDAYRVAGRPAAAARRLEQALVGYEHQEDTMGIASALVSLGAVKLDQGRSAEAIPLLERAEPMVRTQDSEHGMGMVALHLGRAYQLLGDTDRATRHYADAREWLERTSSQSELETLREYETELPGRDHRPAG